MKFSYNFFSTARFFSGVLFWFFSSFLSAISFSFHQPVFQLKELFPNFPICFSTTGFFSDSDSETFLLNQHSELIFYSMTFFPNLALFIIIIIIPELISTSGIFQLIKLTAPWQQLLWKKNQQQALIWTRTPSFPHHLTCLSQVYTPARERHNYFFSNWHFDKLPHRRFIALLFYWSPIPDRFQFRIPTDSERLDLQNQFSPNIQPMQ